MRLILEIPDPLGAALLVQAVKERTSVDKMLIPFLQICANSKPMPTWCSCDDGRTCENHMRAHRGINPEE